MYVHLHCFTDSTVLAYIMKLLNERYNYGVNLVLLSVDEGITGYRDDSLEVTIFRCSITNLKWKPTDLINICTLYILFSKNILFVVYKSKCNFVIFYV